MELDQAGPYVATIIPWAVLPLFFISPISLFLNIQIIRAYFKYDVLRRAPSDILTTLAVVYGLRNILFILMALSSWIFTNENDTGFNDAVCEIVGFSSYIILYLVYTYSSALNVFLGIATSTNSLYTDESTRIYHYAAIVTTALVVIPLFFWGKLYQTPVTVCVYTLGSADGIVPTIFVVTLFYFTYKIYKLRTKSQSAFVAKNKAFTDTFMIYIILGYAYTIERLIKYYVDNGNAYVPYDQVSFFEQATYFVEYLLASLLTFTVFIIRFYDEATRKKLRILIGLDRESSDLTMKLSDGGQMIKRKKSENRKSEEEIYSAEVKFTINMRKVILISMIEGVSWAFDNAQEIIENVSEKEINSLKNLNRIEDYLIKQEDLIKDNPEAGEVCKKIGVELDDARISFHNFLMTLKEISSKQFSFEELKKSFSFRENHDYLDVGFEERDGALSWVTHDSKFRVDIIDANFSKFLITFWRDLFEFQQKKSICVIQPIIAVGQYISLTNPTNAFFMIGRNKHISDELIHIDESFCIKYNEFSSFKDKKRFVELKRCLKSKAYVKPDRFNAYEDILFLQGHELLFSIIVNVVKLLGEDRGSHKEDKYIEISFQNLTKTSSTIDVIKYTKNINSIFDFIYE